MSSVYRQPAMTKLPANVNLPVMASVDLKKNIGTDILPPEHVSPGSTHRPSDVSVVKQPLLPTREQIHTVRLSSIDQSLVRVYVRMGLCYPMSPKTSTEQTIQSFNRFVSETISRVPYLAGRVVPVDGAHQKGMVELQFTRSDIRSYRGVVRHLSKHQYPKSYAQLDSDGMPADALISKALNPLPDKPTTEEQATSSPAMMIQASFIEGGLIVTVYLNHSVGDGLAVAYIIKGFSTIRERIDVDNDEVLARFAAQESTERSKLSSGIDGFADRSKFPIFTPLGEKTSVELRRKPPTVLAPAAVKVLSFSLPKLVRLKLAITRYIKANKERFCPPGIKRDDYVSTFNALATLLWTGILRARMARLDRTEAKDSVVMVPVNIRKKLKMKEHYQGNGVTASRTCLTMDTLLPDLYETEVGTKYGSNGKDFGHALSDSESSSSTDQDTVSDSDCESLVTSLTPVAVTLRSQINKVDDAHVKSVISLQNSAPSADTLTGPNLDLDGTDLVITTWKEMPVYTHSDLGLGLDNARWARKTSRLKEAYGCLILEPRAEPEIMEVMVQIRDDDLKQMLLDDKVMRFVERVA